MAEMSLAKLNELLERALRSLHQEGLSIVTYQEPKPWLPESYWAEVARAEAEHLIQEANYQSYRKAMARRQDADRAEQSAADVMAEWDKDLPTLQGPDQRMRREGWGVQTMHRSGGTLKHPTKGSQQPAYNWECYQCGRPITDNGRDHAGSYSCDKAMMLDPEDGWDRHTPKPWHGEEEDDDDDDF